MTKEAAIATVVLVTAALALYANDRWENRPQAIMPPPPEPEVHEQASLLPDQASESEERPEGQAAAAITAGIRVAGSVAIARLGLTAPLVYVDKADENMFQEALEGGVVHYPGTANPGQPGNVFIFGHSSDYRYREGNYKKVFARLPELEAGDEVVLKDAAGTEFVYAVTEGKVVAADATQYLSQDTDGKKMLTLQTSYPVGTALKRYLVLAELRADN